MRRKSFLEKMFEEFSLGNIFNFEEYTDELFDDYEDLEEEKFEVVKGDYKTLITCKFNKKGFMVSHSFSSEYIKSEVLKEDLQAQLKKALEEEDYKKAAEIKSKLLE